MDPMAQRYDRRSRTYGRCWAPVLREPAVAVLRHVEKAMARPGARLLDVGTGTGTLALAAATRWPGASIAALDISRGMLDQAREAAAAAGPDVAARLTWVEASIVDAAGPDVPPGRFDAVVSSFTLQLVPDRGGALRAILRLLRPGGILAFVTWADNARPAGLERSFDTALAGVLRETGLRAPFVPTPVRAGPIPGPIAAIAELEAAGFAAVGATMPPMRHDFGRAGGRDLTVDYDAAADLDQLPVEARAEVLRRFDALLAALPDDAFRWEPRIVEAWGCRPG